MYVYQYYAVILDDNKLGVIDQPLTMENLLKQERVKSYKQFDNYDDAAEWLIAYIETELEFDPKEMYGIDKEAKNMKEAMGEIKINKFGVMKDTKQEKTLSSLEVLFNHRRRILKQCMVKPRKFKNFNKDFYAVIVVKDMAIGIFETKPIIEEVLRKNEIVCYKEYDNYKEADEFIRTLVPFDKWPLYHLDLGYLLPDEFLKPNQDVYEPIDNYLETSLENLDYHQYDKKKRKVERKLKKKRQLEARVKRHREAEKNKPVKPPKKKNRLKKQKKNEYMKEGMSNEPKG